MSGRAPIHDTSNLCDRQSERAVALCPFAFPDQASQFLADLNPVHFDDVLSRHALTALVALQDDDKPINATLAAQWLQRNNLIDECGGLSAFLIACQDTAFHISPAVAAELYKKVKERSQARALWRRVQQVHERLGEGADSSTVAASLIADVEAISADSISAPAIEFLSPSELRNFDPPHGWNLVGDNHLQRGAVTVIGGAPGIGKSRALIALAVAGARGVGATWFSLPVHRQFRTMILQTENGRIRLKRDFDALNFPELDEFLRVCPPPPYGLRFDRPEFRGWLRRAVRMFVPEVIGIDPWNAVAGKDKQEDYLAAFEAIRGVLPTGDERPAIVIVAHTRKPNLQERTSGAGLLATLAGSYVLGSVPRSAFVVQRASNDTLDQQLVWTCCKNNDGEMGARSAWRRTNGLFEAVADFDWEAFDNIDKVGMRKIDEDELSEVFNGGKPLTRPEVVAALKERGYGKSAAYDAIKPRGRFAARLSEQGGLFQWA